MEVDYYPFGLTFNSYSRENSVSNKFKFQSQEHIDDLGLNWDQFKYRNHQPDIGRFFNVDPLAEKYVYNSPYAFAENRVVDGRELEGLEWMPVNGQGNQVTPTSSEISSYTWSGYTNVTTPTGAPYASSTPETIFSYAPEGTVSQGAVMGTQSGVEGATFYSVNENQQGATEFSALTNSAMEFNGAMNGNTAEGTLTLTNEYANGKTIDAVSQTANSGPWGNGALPNGNYSADQVVSPTGNTGMVVGTNDFAIHLTPNFQTNRGGLYIHPDGGNYVGTLGCVGLTGTANQMQSLQSTAQNRIGAQGSIPVTVNITGNPNNQGGNNNNPTVRE